MFEEMQRRGLVRLIEESECPWSTLVFLNRKNWDLRFCIDYRKLNDVSRKDNFPLPRIDDTLGTLTGAKWFSNLDLKCGSWQVDVKSDKTLFSTDEELWQFTVVPFGLRNA
jgi:hypothetical protein